MKSRQYHTHQPPSGSDGRSLPLPLPPPPSPSLSDHRSGLSLCLAATFDPTHRRGKWPGCYAGDSTSFSRRLEGTQSRYRSTGILAKSRRSRRRRGQWAECRYRSAGILAKSPVYFSTAAGRSGGTVRD